VTALERLTELGIQLLDVPGIETYVVLEREGFAALVERTAGRFGGVGGSGILTQDGFSPLVWRGEDPFFVRKGFERPASRAEAEALRRFSADVKKALRQAPLVVY
jgi:hypothetical protein